MCCVVRAFHWRKNRNGWTRSGAASVALAIVVLFGVSGCKITGGDASGEVTYNLFFAPSDHVEQLLEQGKLDEASKVYGNEREYFAENTKSRTAIAVKLWNQIKEAVGPRINTASDGLDLFEWPAPREQWENIAGRLNQGRAAVELAESHAIVAENRFPLSSLGRLKAKLGGIESRIKEDASAQFARYELTNAPSFFASYPTKLDPKTFLSKHAGAIEERLTNASIGGLQHAQNTYGEALPEETKAAVGELYFKRKIQALKPKGRPSFRGILAAISETREDGFTLKSLPDIKVSLVEATSKTLLKEGQIEFPTAIGLDLPFETVEADLDKAFDSKTAKTADILIVIEVARARATRDVFKNDAVESEFQIGTRKVPNPDYNMAQNEVNQATLRVQQASLNQMSTDNQYCYGIGCLGKALAQIAAAAGVSKANNTLEQAMAKLGSTPMQIDEPVYRRYEFNKATMESTKVATVNYYVIDRLGRQYFKDTFDVQEKEEFVVAYRLRDGDRHREANLAGTQSEEVVAAFEERAVSVKLSSILAEYSRKDAMLRPLPALATIRSEMLRDKNKALAEARSRRFDAKPSKDDDRFDRVVVVYNPQGGMGTGFFIRDDLILTNFHVVEGAKFVEMKLFGGQETFGKVIAKDVRLDLAVVRVQTRGKPVRFFTDKTLPLGKSIEVIGHPKRLLFSITRGVVSAVRPLPSTYMEGGKPVLLIQTDAAVNFGNSGGPLFMGDMVVGVNTWGFVKSQFEGLNFAVHYSEVLEFLKRKRIRIHTGS